MILYLGLRGAGKKDVPAEQLARLERGIRKIVELPRFVSLRVPYGEFKNKAYREKLIAKVVRRAAKIAHERAEWDSQFQGRTVTSKDLRNVQNNSFYYTIEFPHREKHWWRLTVRLRVWRLHIFDCSPANRARGSRYRRACQGKKEEEFTGISRPYRVLQSEPSPKSVESMASLSNARRTDYYLEGLKNTWDGKIRRIFPLVSPVSHSSFHDVFLYLGRREGLRLNQTLKLYTIHLKGYLVSRGFVRVRQVGDNRSKLVDNVRVQVNPKAPYYSRAQVLYTSGSLQAHKGMVTEEYPMYGWHLGFSFAMMPVSSENFVKASPESSLFSLWPQTTLVPSLSLLLGQDVSSFFKSSEVYTHFHLELLAFGYSPSSVEVGLGPGFLLGYGLLKKWNWRRLFFTLGARFTVGIMAENLRQGAGEERETLFRVLLLGGEVLAGLEFFFSLHVSWQLHLGARLLVPIRFAMPPISDYWPLGPFARTALVFYL